MAFDIEMIQSVYSRLEDRITKARKPCWKTTHGF